LGALIGGVLGHQFDRGFGRLRKTPSLGEQLRGSSARSRQQIFFESTFLAMGHGAKAEGRVSEVEVQAARAIMHQMQLHPEDVKRAIALFTEGKNPEFALDTQLQRLNTACRGQPVLLRTFLQIQIDLTLSEGDIKPAERELLSRIAGLLDVGRAELAQMEAVLRARRSFSSGRQKMHHADELAKAYKALGIEAGASDREVKLAYRRLMNRHHPDKLVAKGLPDSMLELAKEQTREIRSAYEVIRKHRGIK